MDEFIKLIPYIGGGGIAAYVALAIFAPSILGVASEYLKALAPVFKGAAEGIVELFKILWAGLKDVADNLSTVIFVLVVATGAYVYGFIHSTTPDKKVCVAEFREDYRFVKRSPEDKARYLKSIGKADKYSWRNWVGQ